MQEDAHLLRPRIRLDWAPAVRAQPHTVLDDLDFASDLCRIRSGECSECLGGTELRLDAGLSVVGGGLAPLRNRWDALSTVRQNRVLSLDDGGAEARPVRVVRYRLGCLLAP
jgi:hypothetical protein